MSRMPLCVKVVPGLNAVATTSASANSYAVPVLSGA
jgi:hypothetical protein